MSIRESIAKGMQVSDSRAVTVDDLVREAVIGDPDSLTWNEIGTRISTPSPDGKHIAVVVRRGNPRLNSVEAELLVYRADQLFKNPKPHSLAKFASTGQFQPLALVRWLVDNNSLVFAGTQGDGPPQVYRVSVSTGELRTLSNERTALQWYDVTPAADRLVTVNEAPARAPLQDLECRQRGCRVTAESFYGAEYGIPETSGSLTIHNLLTGELRTLAPAETVDPDLVDCKNDLKGGLSPDGRYGLQVCKRRRYRWPTWWSDYTVLPELRQLLREGSNGYVRQLILRDFEQGTTRRLSEAPYLYSSLLSVPPLWIDEGRILILPAALESLSGTADKEGALRATQFAVLAIDPRTNATTRIAEFKGVSRQPSRLVWDQVSEIITIEIRDSKGIELPAAAYQRQGKIWIPLQSARHRTSTLAVGSRATANGVDLILEQSLNDRPVLTAVDAISHRRARVLDPNPWLAARRLGQVQAITWKAKNGRQWRGGLYYPPSYRPGVRYPAVLQTHGFEADKFSLYGIARNFVAQPLAAHGILVLQIAENTGGLPEAQEWEAVQAGYEGAVDHLDALGVLDRHRVGIQGWSRTGPYVGYTLTHSSYAFAAGVFSETQDFGWWWYLTQGGLHGATAYGAPPYSEGFDVWRHMSPSFNLDRVKTPMLMWTSGSVAGLWDWYVGLRRLGTPVEYWYLPDGTHDVFKSGERLRTGQLIVDWFRFWLQDEEDSDSQKTDQYRRWRLMKSAEENSPLRTDLVEMQPNE